MDQEEGGSFGSTTNLSPMALYNGEVPVKKNGEFFRKTHPGKRQVPTDSDMACTLNNDSNAPNSEPTLTDNFAPFSRHHESALS